MTGEEEFVGNGGVVELGLTIPLRRHLKLGPLPCGEELDRRFCWDLHVIPLRGRASLLAVHCHTRYTFVLYDLNRLEWARLGEVFQEGLSRSLADAGLSGLYAPGMPRFTRTHGRREVAFLNRAWEDVMAAELALDTSTQSQPFLDSLVNSKPSRCAASEGLGTAAERIAALSATGSRLFHEANEKGEQQ